LRASLLVERRALAGFLLTASAADAASLQQARRDTQRWRAELAAADQARVAGPAAGSRPFTPEGQDAARYR
jgi:hypothetical protein